MRIERHTVVGNIVLWATPFFGGVFLYMLYFQHRFPDRTVFLVFYTILGPLSVWYVIYPNLGLLGRLWESTWGKLFYGLGASVIVTVGKIEADQDIRVLTQSNPSLFPSAQQAITVWNIILLILIVMAYVMLAPFLWMYLKVLGSVLL